MIYLFYHQMVELGGIFAVEKALELTLAGSISTL